MQELLAKSWASDWVTDDPAILIGYSKDNSFETAKKPHLVVLPENTEQVQEVVRIAGRYGMAVQPSSAGHQLRGRLHPAAGRHPAGPAAHGQHPRRGRREHVRDHPALRPLRGAAEHAEAAGPLRHQPLRPAHRRAWPPTTWTRASACPPTSTGWAPTTSSRMTFVMPDGELLRTGSSALPGRGEGLRRGPRAGRHRPLPLLHGHLRGDGRDDHPDLRVARRWSCSRWPPSRPRT